MKVKLYEIIYIYTYMKEKSRAFIRLSMVSITEGNKTK